MFQFFQKVNQTIGICESQQNQKQWPKWEIFLICCAPYVVSAFGFLVFEAKWVFNYAFGFFQSTHVINCIIIYLLFKSGVQSTAAYRELIEKMEVINKIFFVTVYVWLKFVILSAVPYTAVRFFIYDMGEEQFNFFLPTWFVWYESYPNGS